jgi:hypothetical protein
MPEDVTYQRRKERRQTKRRLLMDKPILATISASLLRQLLAMARYSALRAMAPSALLVMAQPSATSLTTRSGAVFKRKLWGGVKKNHYKGKKSSSKQNGKYKKQKKEKKTP